MPEPVQSIRLDKIFASPLNIRKTFDKAELGETAASMRTHGVLEPLIVRPEYGPPHGAGKPTGRFELVDGERRYRSAKLAKLTEVPVRVMSLSDKDVLEIMLISTEQKVKVPDLEKAAGYKRLIEEFGYTYDQVGKSIGRSEATVRDLVKALAAPENAQEGFTAGKLSLSHLTLLGRVPSQKMRERAAAAFLKPNQWNDQALSFRDAKDLLARDYMVQLKGAPFDRKSLFVIDGVPSCDHCPKRTGNNKADYPDVNADVCTDPECYRAKVTAQKKADAAKAEGKGIRTLSTKEARQAFQSWGGVNLANYVELAGQCHQDPKKRTYKQLLGDKVNGDVVLGHDRNGKPHYLVPRATADELLKDVIKTPAPSAADRGHDYARKQAAAREFQQAMNDAAYAAVVTATRVDEAKVLRVLLTQEIADRLYYSGLEFAKPFGAVFNDQPLTQVDDEVTQKRETAEAHAAVATAKLRDTELVPALVWLALDRELSFSINDAELRKKLGLDFKKLELQTKQRLKDKAKTDKEAARAAKKKPSAPSPSPAVPATTAAPDGEPLCAFHGPDLNTQDGALFAALHSLDGPATWKKLRETGASDDEMKQAIALVFGIFSRVKGPMGRRIHAVRGGATPQGCNPQFFYAEAAVRAETGATPTLEGLALVQAARRLCAIPQPKASKLPEATNGFLRGGKAARGGVSVSGDPSAWSDIVPQLAELGVEPDKCRACQCTQDKACPGGCYWVEAGLCSACVALGVEPLTEEGREQVAAIRGAKEARRRKAVKA